MIVCTAGEGVQGLTNDVLLKVRDGAPCMPRRNQADGESRVSKRPAMGSRERDNFVDSWSQPRALDLHCALLRAGTDACVSIRCVAAPTHVVGASRRGRIA